MKLDLNTMLSIQNKDITIRNLHIDNEDGCKNCSIFISDQSHTYTSDSRLLCCRSVFPLTLLYRSIFGVKVTMRVVAVSLKPV